MSSGPAPDLRGVFHEAARAFVALVVSVKTSDLDRPGTAQWSVRELIAHADRAFLATETVLAATPDPSTRFLDSAAAYFRAAMSLPSVHDGITERARAAAVELGDDLAGSVRADAGRVLPLVDATPLDREVQHFAGRLRFGDYLVTRVTELVLHSVDLQLALRVAPTAPPRAAMLVRDLMVELSDRVDPLAVASALAVRPLPGGCNVLG